MSPRLSSLVLAKPEILATATLSVETPGPGFTDLSQDVAAFVAETGAASGLVTLYMRHTSASLTIQENADPDVLADLMTALARLAPEGGWRHDSEGPDDMPSHIKAMLTATALQIPVRDRSLLLGRWQAIYLIEHRAQPHRRDVVLQLIGAK